MLTLKGLDHCAHSDFCCTKRVLPFFAILLDNFASINMKSALIKKVLGLQDPPNVHNNKSALPHESDPTVREWLSDGIPSRQQAGQYFVRLLPFLNWIPHYNLQWFLGDLVAGKCLRSIESKPC